VETNKSALCLSGADPCGRHQRLTRRLRRSIAMLLVFATVTGASMVIGAPRAAAAEGLNIASDYVYRLTDDGVLTVEATYTLTNETPNSRRGFTITSFYYDAFGVPLPELYDNLTVTDGDRALTHEIVADEDAGEVFEIVVADFRRRLNYRQTTTIVVTYDVVGSAPRSDLPDRLNPAYAFFAAWGYADDGQLNVTIELPRTYDVQNLGSYMSTETGSEVITLTATDIADPFDFSALIVARNDDALTESPVETGDVELVVRGWPGDDEWQKFATSTIGDGIPILEALIGSEWPEDDDFVVIQSVEPNFHGYAGWYDVELGQIVVDEWLDTRVMLHELSHAWFNGETFEDRWIIEGFAEEFSRQASIEAGDDPPAAHPPSSLEPKRLNEWTNLDRGDATELWGYTGAGWVMQELFDDVGAGAFGDLVVAIDEGAPTFGDEDGAGESELPPDWRRLLDVAERQFGSEVADGLFRDWVVTEAQAEILDERSTAFARVDELAEAGGEWFVPVGVRESAEEWDFEPISELVDSALDVLVLRDELDDRSVAHGLVSHAIGERDYEAATDDFGAVVGALSVRLNAVGTVEATTERYDAFEPTFLQEVGLWGEDYDAEYAEVREAYDADDSSLVAGESVEMAMLLADSEALGRFRVTLAALASAAVLLLLTMMVVWVVRRRRKRARRTVGGEPVPKVAVPTAFLGTG